MIASAVAWRLRYHLYRSLHFYSLLFEEDLSRGERKRSNKSLQLTAGRRESSLDFMKQFSMFATLAAASGGSAPSR